MKSNVAVFYDIENLLKGYNFSQNLIDNLSLKDILLEIKQIDVVNRIAVQRAYANWSDSRLAVMKGEINELGIEPIQIFGFSRQQKKNAADIQLAVDAIDLAYIRPGIEVFVIISGDGGFSSLAKKLHEYGKFVIGCAYRSSKNKVFESVCDRFIEITDPEFDDYERSDDDLLESQPNITNPTVLRMAKVINPIESKDKDKVLEKSREIINWFANDTQLSKDLSKHGIHVSVIREAFKYGIKDFDHTIVGFPKFGQYLQLVCADTKIGLFNLPPSDLKLAYRNSLLKEDYQPLEDLDRDYLHSLENYHSILCHKKPIVRLPDKDIFQVMVNIICTLPEQELSFGDTMEYVSDRAEEVESKSINNFLFTLINLEILSSYPKDLPLVEQKLFLKSNYKTQESITKKIIEAIEDKLTSFWGDELNTDTLNELISGLS
ncbi:NYN domain-containing protein [Oxynema sp. CENA135]|nr:NYN domain-containing protein [Oxynema sp. CENA135]